MLSLKRSAGMICGMLLQAASGRRRGIVGDKAGRRTATGN